MDFAEAVDQWMIEAQTVLYASEDDQVAWGWIARTPRSVDFIAVCASGNYCTA